MTTPDRLRRTLLCWAAVAACAWAVVPLHAQADKKLRKEYALIFGTVWDKQGRAVYGARIGIPRAGDKKPRWELISDHNGEFAQRVPPGRAEYIIRVLDTREVVDPAVVKRKFNAGQTEGRVRIENDERADIGLHLTE